MNFKKVKLNFLKKQKTICPVCMKYHFVDKYDICPVCGWENDPIQKNDSDFKGGANRMSLKEAIEAYKNEK